LVAVETSQRAWIAFAFGGRELRFVAVAKPELCLPVRRLAERWCVCDFLDRPAGAREPFSCVGNGGLYFRHGIEPVGIEADSGAFRARRTIQRRRHPPGVARIKTRH